MANLSYCRFENTLSDLLDCEENLDEMLNHGDVDGTEYKAARRLIVMCNRIAANYCDEYGE